MAKEDVLALSLDDIIKRNRGSSKEQPRGGNARGEGGRRGRGAARSNGGTARVAIVNTVQTKRSTRGRRSGASGTFRDYDGTLFEDKPPAPGRPTLDKEAVAAATIAALEGNAKWKHDKYEGPASRRNLAQRGGGSKPAVPGYKLQITNLDFVVTNDDIKELFEPFGGLKHSTVHWDHSDRSLGTAEATFATKQAAEKALKQYNGVALDGKPMHIELVDANAPGSGTLSSGLRVGGGRLGGQQRTVTASQRGPALGGGRGGRVRSVGNADIRPWLFDMSLRSDDLRDQLTKAVLTLV